MSRDYHLGLDLGTHSIGWGCVAIDAHDNPTALLDAGARIFDQVLEEKTQAPKNAKRRLSRLRRRQTERRADRRGKLKRLLVRHGLLPAAILDPAADGASLCNELGDPYQLRTKALTTRLEPHELGRVLLHLVQRRGFKSNRKTDRGNKDTGVVKEGIAGLRAEMAASGAPTLGAYLAGLPEKRRRHTAREMFEAEYEALCAVQSPHFPGILDGEVGKRIRALLFHQRPLKLATNTLGDCQFETRRPRACKARLEAQEFLLLQAVANLRVMRPGALDFEALTPDERQRLRRELSEKGSRTWDQVRRLLQIPRAPEGRINLEEGGTFKKMPGNDTAAVLAKAVGPRWNALDSAARLALVEDLLTISDEAALARRLQDHWTFDEPTTAKLLAANLPGEDAYLRLSMKAVRKLTPKLEEGLARPEGCTYAEAVMGVYGANRGNANRPVVRELPEPEDLRNPAVRKALFELRKVIHAIIRTHGLPRRIRLEMARDLKHSARQRAEIQAGQNEERKKNEQAAQAITAEFGRTGNPSGADILRYRLWKELVEANGGLCPYTGREISQSLLFTDAIDIEHILPLSRSMDDSKANKTLCFADWNRHQKRNRTPWEACGFDVEAHAAMLMRVRKLPKAKFRRFNLGRGETDPAKLEKLLAEHATRQLQDTRYLAVAARDYLAMLGIRVEVAAGPLTAALRHRWGLDSLLNPDGPGKNREDHRHHSVDAVVIACTTPAMVQRAARAAASPEFLGSEHDARGWRSSHLLVQPPWPAFRESLRTRLESMHISHAPTHAVSGPLHAETAYGAHRDPITGETRYHVRKRLADLTPAMLDRIADADVRRRVQEFFAQHGKEAKARLENGVFPLHADGATPIKRVRIANVLSPESVVTITSRPNTHYESGSNHHVEILEHLDTGKWKGRFVTTFAAAQRARRKQPIVDRTAEAGWRFVMSLSNNDSVEVDTPEGRRIYRVQKMTSKGSGLTMRILTTTVVADTDNRGVLRRTPNTLRELNPQKVVVTPLGVVRRAGD